MNDYNVVSITECQEQKSLENYLNILSFNDLIIEATESINEISTGVLTKEKANRSLIILNEFKNRLMNSSVMKSEVEESLSALASSRSL